MKLKNKLKNLTLRVSVFLFFSSATILCVAADETVTSAPPTTTDKTGEAAWNAVMDFLIPWIWRLGGAVMLIGGIMLGLAFKNDDADGKTRALQTIIAGAIVTAVGVSSNVFLVN